MATRGRELQRILESRVDYIVDEDTSFTAGDSPQVIDVEGGLQDELTSARRGRTGYIVCDGTGDILIEISSDGTNYLPQFTLKQNEVWDAEQMDISKIRITHSGTDSAYRSVIA
jgi:hypothetical protein